MQPSIKPTSPSGSSRRTDRLFPKGRLETRLDSFLLRAALEPRPWWLAIFHWVLVKLARITLHFGRTFPYLWRPWVWGGTVVISRLDKRRHETAKTIFLRRLFSLRRNADERFHPIYAAWNWLFALALLWFLPAVVGNAMYAYLTYPFGEYRDVVVTQAYRNITNEHTYAVHGYQIDPDGTKEELYFEIGANVWFWQLYPEFTFGRIPVLGRCTFQTYGISLRLLKDTSSFYVLNPWIVSAKCTPPTVIPPDHSG